MSASGLSTDAASNKESGADRLRRHTALLVIVMTALIVLALFPHLCAAVLRHARAAGVCLRHCAARLQSAVWLHGLAVVRPRAIRCVGCLWRGGVLEQARRQELRSDSSRFRADCGCGGHSGRPARGALRADFLRHPDARFRHAVSLVPVQVLRHHRRRHRHSRAASGAAR